MHRGLGVDEFVMQSPLAVHTRSAYIHNLCTYLISSHICGPSPSPFFAIVRRKNVSIVFDLDFSFVLSLPFVYICTYIFCLFSNVRKPKWKSLAAQIYGIRNSTGYGGDRGWIVFIVHGENTAVIVYFRGRINCIRV